MKGRDRKLPLEEVNQFRVGVIGPDGCGKSSIIAKLHRIEGVSHENEKGPGSNYNSHLNKVMCVPVWKGHSLGIKIVQHERYLGWCCVHSFMSSGVTSHQSSIKADGRVMVGDLLVAIGNTSLHNKSPFEVISILKASKHDRDDHLLITFLRPGNLDTHDSPSIPSLKSSDSSGGDLDSSLTSSVSSICSESQDVYIDHPTVVLTTSYFCYTGKPSKPSKSLDITSYHMVSPSSNRLQYLGLANPPLRDLPSILEIVDIPGNDPEGKVLREWLPRLDAMVLVYSATSASSLLSLEKTYMRRITKLCAEEANELPLVIVCNKTEDNPPLKDEVDAINYSYRLAKHLKKRYSLIVEGRAMAEAWNAPFFTTSCVDETKPCSSAHRSPGSNINQSLEYIFETAIQQSILKTAATDNMTDWIYSTGLSSGVSSFFNSLPLIGDCFIPLDDAKPRRSLQCVAFSSHERKHYLQATEDYYSADSDNIPDKCQRPPLAVKENFVVQKKSGYTHDAWKVTSSKYDVENISKLSNDDPILQGIGCNTVGCE